MKRYLFLFSLISICLISCFPSRNMQIKNDPLMRTWEEFDPAVLAQLKGTKTVFFLPDYTSQTADSFKQAIQSGWTLTPLIFDSWKNLDKYADPSYSFFFIEVNTVYFSHSTFNHQYLALRLLKDVNKKGKADFYGLGRVELSPAPNSFITAAGKDADVRQRIYEKGHYLNWTPTLLHAHLAAIQTEISGNRRASMVQDVKDDALGSLLAKNTLYVPKQLMVNHSGFTLKQTEKTENPFAAYPYKYKIATDEELYKVFETDKTGVLLFEFVEAGGEKWISVFDVKRKKKVYMLNSSGRNVTGKDIDKLLK